MEKKERLFTGKMSKEEFGSYDFKTQKFIIGRKLMNIITGDVNKIVYANKRQGFDFKPPFDKYDDSTPSDVLPNILFRKGKIKPLFKIINETYNNATLTFDTINVHRDNYDGTRTVNVQYNSIDALANTLSMNFNGYSWSPSGGAIMGISKFLYGGVTNPKQKDHESFEANIFLAPAFERMRRITYHDILTGNYVLIRNYGNVFFKL